MIIFLKEITAVLLTVLNVVSFPFFGWYSGSYEPKNPDECRLNFAAISDTHIDGSGINAFMLDLGMEDFHNADSRLDALVMAGDLTDGGELQEWEKLCEVMAKYDPAQEIILACGNHDTWTEDDGIVLAKQYFTEYNKKIAGREISEMYYSTTVNGYPFIVLGSEDDRTSAYFSDTQLEWLEAEMAAAAKTGLPIFVVSHWPINESHGLPETWGDDEPEPDDGGIGDQSDAVETILKKYDNVFMITGHIHSGWVDESTESLWNYKSIESDGSFHSINLPSYMYLMPRGQFMSGKGFQFEVYDDYVLIRHRSYSGGVWYSLNEAKIPLV